MHYGASKRHSAGKHVCARSRSRSPFAPRRDLVDLASQHRRTLLTSLHRRYNHVLSPRRPSGNRKVTHINAHDLEKIGITGGADTWYLDARDPRRLLADTSQCFSNTLSLFITT